MTARTYKAGGIDGTESYRWKDPQSPVICVRPGDVVTLSWWGDSGVPKWCSRGRAVVLRLNRKRIVVHPLGSHPDFTLTVLPERHVSGVRYVHNEAAWA